MPNLPTRNNNPGDLKDPTTGSFKQFSDPKQGYAALLNDLHSKQVGTTTTGLGPSSSLADFAKVYAPSSDNNNSAKYAADLANQIGVAPDSQLKDLDLGKWADAVAKNEGYTPQNNSSIKVAPPTPPGQQETQINSQSSFGGALQPPSPPQTTTQLPNADLKQEETFTGDIAQGNYGGAALTAGKGLLNAVIGAPVSLGAHLAQGAAGLTADFASKTGLLGGQAEADKIRAKLAAPTTSITGSTVQPLKSGLGGAEQIGGDALQTALLGVAPEVNAGKSLLGRLGVNAAIGAGFGAGGALSEGGGWNDVLKQAGIGAATGGVIGGAGEVLSKAAQYLPQRIARTFIPGLNAETAQYAVNRGLGAPSKMLEESNANLTKVGNALGAAIKQAVGPAEEAQTIPGQQVFQKIADQFKDSGMTAQDVADSLKKLIPLKKDLIDRIFSGNGTLEDLHRLNSSIGKATFKTVFDDPAVKAGKDLGNAAYHIFGNIIKTAAPEAAPYFDEYSKELQLNGALSKAVRRGEKAKPFTLRDIVALFAGIPGGPVGMATTYGLEKAATSPSVNLRAAGLLNKLNSPTAQSAGQFAKAPAIQGAQGLLRTLLPH